MRARLRYGARMKPVPRWFVAICWVLAILFSISVGLQVNDPDPIRWMVIYGLAGLACAFLPPHRITCGACLAIGVAGAAWCAYLTSQIWGKISPSDLFLKMSEKGGAVEVGREAGGLAIVALSMIGLAAYRATRD